jgi:hypothetical protein
MVDTEPPERSVYYVRLSQNCGMKILTGRKPSNKLDEKRAYNFFENEFSIVTYFQLTRTALFFTAFP